MIRKLLLILRFYYSAMFFFCAAVSVALAWLVKVHGPEIIPMCMLGKAAVYPLYLYVWIVQRYGDEFFYYRNLGRPAARTAGRKLRRGLCLVLRIVETDGPFPV